MTVSEIINIALAALTVAAGFAASYFKANGKLNAKAAAFISQAEETYKDTITGGQKFQIVVGQLYKLIPAPVRVFLPQSIVAALVQNAFDQIDAFAKVQADKATSQIEK